MIQYSKALLPTKDSDQNSENACSHDGSFQRHKMEKFQKEEITKVVRSRVLSMSV